MIRMIAPRCEHRRNQPSFRVLLCRAHDGQGCGRAWTANGRAELIELMAQRESHEALCETGMFEGLPPNRPLLAAPRPALYPVG